MNTRYHYGKIWQARQTRIMEEVVMINLLFFAKSKEIVGQKHTQLYLPQKSTGRKILESILSEFPELELIEDTVVLSLNEEYIDNNTEVNLKAGDEIAVIPPIAKPLSQDPMSNKYTIGSAAPLMWKLHCLRMLKLSYR